MSKELEALEILKQDIGKCYEDELNIVESALKALEIIKNKQVEIRWVVGDKPTIDSVYGLTDEEYNLLMEIL